MFEKWGEDAKKDWDGLPTTLPRLASEIWDVIKDEDWVLTGANLQDWCYKLWDFDKPYRHAGQALGTGTQIGISLGVALAHRGTGRLVVDIQPDGDLMFDAGALWSAAKNNIPMLIVMYNNRAYYNDWEHQIRVAQHRGTPVERAYIAQDITGPNPDFATLAKSMGWYAEGPIEKPADIAAGAAPRHRAGEGRQAGAGRYGGAAAVILLPLPHAGEVDARSAADGGSRHREACASFAPASPLASPPSPASGGGNHRPTIARTICPRLGLPPITGREAMQIKTILSHAAVGCVAAAGAYLFAAGHVSLMPSFAQAQAPSGQKSTELFKQTMDDVGRTFTVRLTERDGGNASGPHRHPGSYTVGYIVSGAYEVKINDGPLRTLHAGEVFFEPPNALHAVSRNASATEPVKYLVIQVSDPSKPAIVPEK